MLHEYMLKLYRISAFVLLALFLANPCLADLQLIKDKPTSLVYPPFWHTPFGIHRGTTELLEMFLGDQSELLEPQDLACTRLLSTLDKPDGAIEFQVTILGANAGKAQLIYNRDLTHLNILGDASNDHSLFSYPLGTAMHSDGTTYVTDSKRLEVFRFRVQKKDLVPSGKLLPPPGGWQAPWGVALDSQGALYVTDSKRNQVFIYSPQGDLLQVIGPQLSDQIRLSQPRSLTVVDPLEPWSFYHDGYIFLTDQGGKRLLRLDLSGQLQKSITSKTVTPQGPEFSFAWMELDYYENIWITDSNRSQVHKFDRHLNFLTSYGQPGNGDYHFLQPTGIAIHRHFGQVFIAEKYGAHYFWIGSDILRAFAQRDTQQPHLLRIEFFLTEPAWLTVEVKSASKQTLLFLRKKQWADSGKHVIFWNVAQKPSAQVSGFLLTAEATYSSARYIAKQVWVPTP
jgi:NHL repeat